MRLVDADKIVMMDADAAIDYLVNAKPDYDVESVVEQLEDCGIEQYGHEKVISVDIAIEIVKTGGVNEIN